MNRQQFSEFVRNPATVNAETLKMLEDLVKRYPYCQTGQLLYTLNLLKEDQLQFHTQLKKAAAYAGDRRRLKEIIQEPVPSKAQPVIQMPLEKTSAQEVPPELEFGPQPDLSIGQQPEPESEKQPETEDTGAITMRELDSLPEWHTEEVIPESATSVNQFPPVTAASLSSTSRLSREELLAVVRRRLAEINAEKSASHLAVSQPASKEAIIDRFIQDEPKISRPRTAFFSPTDTSMRSNLDDEEIVSETLALLYAKQGNIQKAIHIYEKLSLLNQEKSRYFAAQIQQLTI